MLAVEALDVTYGRIPAVRGVSLEVGAGELIGLIGPNGAGKTSVLHAITGVVPVAGGQVRLDGASIRGLAPDQIVRRGVALVPEGRRIFATLTVAENLRIGTTSRRDRQAAAADVERVLERFPVLATYYRSSAGKLSGGEQQQLAIARALLSAPRLLLLDEPSLGLAPRVVDLVFETLAELRADGVTMLLVEQNAMRTIGFADRTYVLSAGSVVLGGSRAELQERGDLASTYLGVAR